MLFCESLELSLLLVIGAFYSLCFHPALNSWSVGWEQLLPGASAAFCPHLAPPVLTLGAAVTPEMPLPTKM